MKTRKRKMKITKKTKQIRPKRKPQKKKKTPPPPPKKKKNKYKKKTKKKTKKKEVQKSETYSVDSMKALGGMIMRMQLVRMVRMMKKEKSG